MIDLPLSLRYIHSTFPALIRVGGLVTVPLALQSCQAVKEERAADSSTTALTRVCRQQSQPPSWGCNTEISDWRSIWCTSHPTWVGVDHARCAQSIPLCPSIAGSTKPPWRACQGHQLAASFAESRDFSRLHLWKMIFQPWSIFNELLFVPH